MSIKRHTKEVAYAIAATRGVNGTAHACAWHWSFGNSLYSSIASFEHKGRNSGIENLVAVLGLLPTTYHSLKRRIQAAEISECGFDSGFVHMSVVRKNRLEQAAAVGFDIRF
jgi:hypothetical protein